MVKIVKNSDLFAVVAVDQNLLFSLEDLVYLFLVEFEVDLKGVVDNRLLFGLLSDMKQNAQLRITMKVEKFSHVSVALGLLGASQFVGLHSLEGLVVHLVLDDLVLARVRIVQSDEHSLVILRNKDVLKLGSLVKSELMHSEHEIHVDDFQGVFFLLAENQNVVSVFVQEDKRVINVALLGLFVNDDQRSLLVIVNALGNWGGGSLELEKLCLFFGVGFFGLEIQV